MLQPSSHQNLELPCQVALASYALRAPTLPAAMLAKAMGTQTRLTLSAFTPSRWLRDNDGLCPLNKSLISWGETVALGAPWISPFRWVGGFFGSQWNFLEGASCFKSELMSCWKDSLNYLLGLHMTSLWFTQIFAEFKCFIFWHTRKPNIQKHNHSLK